MWSVAILITFELEMLVSESFGEVRKHGVGGTSVQIPNSLQSLNPDVWIETRLSAGRQLLEPVRFKNAL